MSKIKTVLTLMFVIVFAFTGCNAAPNNTETPPPVPTGGDMPGDALVYAPFKPNTIYSYDGGDNPYANWDIFIDYIHAESNLYQRRINTMAGVMNEVMQYENGELCTFFIDADVYHHLDLTGSKSNTKNTVLKEPLEVGNKWTRSIVDNVTVEAEITGMDVEVTVPYGTFKAMEITLTAHETGEITKEYYVKDLGLVLVDIAGSQYTQRTELKDVREGAYPQDVIFFFLTEDESFQLTVAGEIRNILFETNCDIREIMEEQLRKFETENAQPLISPNTRILDFVFDKENSRLKVNFSKELVDEMNLGSAYESTTLQAIVDTLGYFFIVREVAVNVEGQGYSSGHIILGADEYIPVQRHNLTL